MSDQHAPTNEERGWECAHGCTGPSAVCILDHEPTTRTSDESGAMLALIEGAKLDARNSMRSDPRVWHEALEAALDKVLPGFWRAAAGYRKPGPVTDAQVEAAVKIIWIAHQDDDPQWAARVVDDLFSPADDWPDEAIHFGNVARAALEAARSVTADQENGSQS